VRGAIKWFARLVANGFILPVLILFWIGVLFLGRDRSLEGTSQWMALWPGILGQYLRRAFLAWAIKECHPSATICFGTIFSKYECYIGENVYIGPFCSLGSVIVERNVLIATAAHITSGSRMHGIDDLDIPIREQVGIWETVTIGEGSWIGTGSVIMANIGRDTVVGAGAVVTNALPEKVIAGGVPAKVIRSREEKRKGLLSHS
jgi:virginiamycin A acetyltransferase